MTMTESQYNVFEFKGSQLKITMVDSLTQRKVDDVWIDLLGTEQTNPHSGRFVNFVQHGQEHHVYLGLVNMWDTMVALENSINWIAEECSGKWSLVLATGPEDVAARHVLFSFDEAGDAMLFRLSIVKMGV